MTENDALGAIEDALEAVRPDAKRRLTRLRSVGKELRVTVFSLNAGAALAFSGIYVSLAPAVPETGTPGWLVAAVTSFALGGSIFIASLVLEAAVLRKRIWSDPSKRFDKFLTFLDRLVFHAPFAEGTGFVAGLSSVGVGFVWKSL